MKINAFKICLWLIKNVSIIIGIIIIIIIILRIIFNLSYPYFRVFIKSFFLIKSLLNEPKTDEHKLGVTAL